MKANDIIPIQNELKFMLRMVLVVVCSIGLSLLLLVLLLKVQLGANSDRSYQQVAAIYENLNLYVFMALMAQFVFSTILLYFITLLYSHKIAGPVYRLKLLLTQYLNGKNLEEVSFRESDYIHGIAERFTHFFQVRKQRQTLLNDLQNHQKSLATAKKDEASQIKNKMRQCLEKLQKLHQPAEDKPELEGGTA